MNIPLAKFTNCSSTQAPPATRRLPQAVSLLVVAVAFVSAFSDVRAEVLFEGMPEPGPFTINFAQSSDGGLEVDTTGFEEPWRTFLASVPTQITFSPGKRYKIGYDYKVQKLKSDETRFYHYLDVPSDESSRRGHQIWTAKAGESGRKEFTTTLADSDAYRLAMGVVNGGAITINNLKIEEVPPPKLDNGFIYQSPMENDERLIINPAGKIVDGGFEVTTTGKEWNKYLDTSAQELRLIPGHTYKVSYNYNVEDAKEGARMNHHVRVPSKSNDGSDPELNTQWVSWAAKPGESGHKELTFQVTEPGCQIMLGDYGGTSVRIEAIEIEDLGE